MNMCVPCFRIHTNSDNMKHERDDDVRGPLPKRQCHLTPASWAATDNNATDMPGGGPRSGQGGIEMAVVPRAGSTPSRKLALTDAGDEHSGEVAPSGYVSRSCAL